ncbi:MAG: carboxypeptidase-like regulatory domain-containing protein [Planctomycetaceae bacterium]
MTLYSRNALSFVLMMAALAASSSDAVAQRQPAEDSESFVAPSSIAADGVSTLKPPVIPIVDVALDEDGLIRGRVLNENGKPLDGAQVVIRRDEELLHKLLTNKQGEFSTTGLRPGVYTIATVQGGGLYRLWPKNIAPPSARAQALILAKGPVMRAQYGGGGLVEWASIGVGIAGLTVGIISLDKINDVEDDVNDLKSP